MTSIKSKIGFHRLAILFANTCFLFAGIWLTRMGLIVIALNEPLTYFHLLWGPAICVIGIYGFRWDYKYVHSVTIDDEKIAISRWGTFYWQDLESITLHTTKLVYGTRNFKRKYYKAIMINFKNEKAIFLFDIKYSNINEIRAFLEEHVINRKS